MLFAELASKTGRKTLVFYNHYDVQPVEPVELWKNPPFSATVEDGRVYARGASDNKGNIISRLMAINALLKVTGDVPCNIKWVIEGEEEIGSPHFFEHYAVQGAADRRFCGLGVRRARLRGSPLGHSGLEGNALC
jgi:acetylornithine deacetylase/succinyl-diaminopimelate desuccinylase-like protein